MFAVKKEVAETILKKSNPNHDSLGRFTFGKKLAPNTGVNGGKTLSEDEQRCLLANTTDPIEGIEPLQLTVTNLSIIHDEVKKINESLKNGNYQYNGMKITSVDEEHLLSHFVGGVEVTRPLSDLQSHAAYLPFVMPILNSNCGHDTKRDRVEPDGRKTYEFVKRATITENNKSKNIGVALILKENERNELTVSIRTIFRLFDKKNLIKSWQVGELNLLDRQNALLNSTRNLLDNVKLVSFKCLTPNKIIANRKKMSSEIQKSNEYSTKRIQEEFKKNFTVKLKDITENNKAKKVDQLEKALNCVYTGTPFKINHIPADNSTNYGDLTLRILNFDKTKIEKAVRNVSFSLDVPLKAAKGEVFYYQSQEDLTNMLVAEGTKQTRAVYDFMISYFGLPERTLMSKAYLKYKGKILYSPETGEPINKRDWKKFVKALQTFLNHNRKGFARRIILTSRKLGKLLEKMSKYQTAEQIRKMKLEEIKEPGKKTGIDWTETDPNKIEKIFEEKAEKFNAMRIEIAEQSAAQKITKIDDITRNDMQQIIIDGIKNKKSKGQVSQDLFDRCANLNRDIQRIADTEIQSNINNAYIQEAVKQNLTTGKKSYFIRMEVIDDNTCEKCKKLNNKIAVWSDTPLENEKVKDPYAEYAIWDGKDDWNFIAPNGVKHPYCRGVWSEWNPEFDELPGKEVKKSLTFSGYKLQGRKKFAGFNVSIENKKGTYREGTDSNGHKWRVKMWHDYGYIRGSVGTDGDHVDCYLGPNENAKKVYIVHQQDPDTKKYDEDKCMLGFDTLIDAKSAYLKQYDRPGFLQSITIMDLEEFRKKVLSPENKGKMIKSLETEMKKSVSQTIAEIFNSK